MCLFHSSIKYKDHMNIKPVVDELLELTLEEEESNDNKYVQLIMYILIIISIVSLVRCDRMRRLR